MLFTRKSPRNHVYPSLSIAKDTAIQYRAFVVEGAMAAALAFAGSRFLTLMNPSDKCAVNLRRSCTATLSVLTHNFTRKNVTVSV